jgi:hypothetical protein
MYRPARLPGQPIWQASAEDTVEFGALTELMTFNRGEGLPGRVWATGKPAWIVDVAADPNSPRAHAAATVGLRAAFCLPNRSPRGILGTMECFARELHEPNEPLLRSMGVLGTFGCQSAIRAPEGTARMLRQPTGPSRGSSTTAAPRPLARSVTSMRSATST